MTQERERSIPIAETTFVAIGVLLLLWSIRTFTSGLYMSLYGQVSNETVGAIALAVFAASALAPVVAWRLEARGGLALSGVLLAVATLLAAAVRNGLADIVLSAAAVVGGTWWLALTQHSRAGGGVSSLAVGLPVAIAADLGIRALTRSVPVVELTALLAVALVAAGVLLFFASGLAAFGGDRSWTTPGPRGALALATLPVLLLVGETGGTDPGQILGSASLGRGPEGPGIAYLAAAAAGIGMAAGAVAMARLSPPHRLVAGAALGLGAAVLWAHVPYLSALGGVVLAGGMIAAASVLPDTAARPAAVPVLGPLALALGWVLFVALAFGFYAYYAYPPAAWIASALVMLGVIAASPPPGPRLGPAGVLLIGAVAAVLPIVAYAGTPPVTTAERPTFRLMTYNVHQGFDEGNVPALDAIADVISVESPDIVVLQEVARGWMIAQQQDVLTVLSERTGLPYVFGPAIGDAYGNAVLSRVPISDVRYISYQRQKALRHQPRGAILFRASGVLIVATHLDHIADASDVRQGQVRAILDAVGDERPAIVTGDLDALPGTPEMKLLEDARFRDLAKDDGADQPTWPASRPEHRIDYVWGAGVFGSQAHTVASTASDHRPLVVNIAIQR